MAGYRADHDWMQRTFPKTGRCEMCARTDRKTEYACADHGRRTRNRANWFEMCRPCHWAFDGCPLPDNSGRKQTADERAKRFVALKGRPKTPEHRAAMRLAWERRAA